MTGSLTTEQKRCWGYREEIDLWNTISERYLTFDMSIEGEKTIKVEMNAAPWDMDY